MFLSLSRVLPDRYPLALPVENYIADEQRLGRLLDYAVIVPRLQRLYDWSAEELGEPRLLELVRDGNPTYAWPDDVPESVVADRTTQSLQVFGTTSSGTAPACSAWIPSPSPGGGSVGS